MTIYGSTVTISNQTLSVLTVGPTILKFGTYSINPTSILPSQSKTFVVAPDTDAVVSAAKGSAGGVRYTFQGVRDPSVVGVIFSCNNENQNTCRVAVALHGEHTINFNKTPEVILTQAPLNVVITIN